MSSSRPLAVLAVLAIGIALVGSAWVALPPPTDVQAKDLSTPESPPAYQGEPIGIVEPLGRYEVPKELILAAEGVAPAPSVLSGAAPPMGTSFDGLGMEFFNGGYLSNPPDTHSATGLDRIVEVTNGHVAIYNKAGGLIAGGDKGAGAVTVSDFCGSAGPPTEDKCYDPKVVYDQESDRFVAVMLQGYTPATTKLHVMVSKTSGPANFTSDWDKFSHDASANIDGTPGWFDYPGLGVSPDAVVVTGNIYPDLTSSSIGTKIRVFDKTELYDGDTTATYQDIDNTTAASGFTIQPAHHLSSPPQGTFYLLQSIGPTRLWVSALTGVPASPVWAGAAVATPNMGTCLSGAPQMGTSKVIDTICVRMMNAVWRDGSLWGTLTGSDVAQTRAVVQWFEIKTNGPTLRQHGAIDGGPGEFTFMPSISVDASGNAAMTYSQSSGIRYPEMRYTARAAGDALGSMRDPVVAKTSVGFQDDTNPAAERERWGDYSSTVVDPSDGSFWISNEYVKVAASGAGNNARWGTWHVNLSFDMPTSPSIAFLPIVVNNHDPSQLLGNGNFDSGAWEPWATVGSPQLDDQIYHSAPYSARLAGRDDADSDYVAQAVTVPASTTEATLDYWFRASGNDSSDPPDFMCVEILDGEGTTVLVPVACYALHEQPQNEWLNGHQMFTGSELAPLLGQSVYVSFQGWTNSTNPSTAWVDDVTFRVTR